MHVLTFAQQENQLLTHQSIEEIKAKQGLHDLVLAANQAHNEGALAALQAELTR
jgi:hypothetical protein